MKTLITLIFAVLVPSTFAVAATAAVDKNEYFIQVESTGSRIPIKLIKSTIPFNKSYSGLSDTDKLTFRSYYEDIPAANTPPFPENGMRQIAADVKDAHSKMRKPGPLFAVASIDKLGKVSKVSVYASPDERMSQLISASLWDTEFQPGKCAGEPCAMEFVLDWELLRMRAAARIDSEKKGRNSRR
jgi:hypothetical protein